MGVGGFIQRRMAVHPLGQQSEANAAANHGPRHLIERDAAIHGEPANVVAVELHDQFTEEDAVVPVQLA